MISDTRNTMPPKFTFRKRNGNIKFSCFVNRDPDRTTPRGNPTCFQCEAIIGPDNNQRQCSRSTCIHTPYCWQHTRSLLNLRVMKSGYLRALSFDGLGLYAWDPKKADQKRSVFRTGYVLKPQTEINGKNLYQGERLTKNQVDDRYDYHDEECDHYVEPTAPYVEHFGNERHYYDAACRRGIASFANSVRRGRNHKKRRPRRQNEQRSQIRYYKNNALITIDGNIQFIRPVYHGEEILIDYGRDYWKGITFDCRGNIVSSGSHSTNFKVSG